jgi:hypothetical protein
MTLLKTPPLHKLLQEKLIETLCGAMNHKALNSLPASERKEIACDLAEAIIKKFTKDAETERSFLNNYGTML